MISSFRHKGLKALYDGKASARVMQQYVPKLLRILSVLDEAASPQEMDLTGFHLHRLKGELKSHFSVSVSGNWRVTFLFDGKHAADVNYLDYHSL